MAILFLKKGDYRVTAQDIQDTLNSGGGGGGDANFNGNIFWKANTAHNGELTHNNTADQVYTFPNFSGHVALIENPQIWSGAQTFNTGNLKAVNLTATASTLQFIQTFFGFIKATVNNDGFGDLITVGGNPRSVTLQAPDFGSKVRVQFGNTDYYIFDGNDTNFYPSHDNFNTCGRSGNRWSAIWAANGTIQTSFSRFKKNIVYIQDDRCLDICKQLTPAFFDWKDEEYHGTNRNFGIIADALETELPEAVAGEDGVYDRSLIALLVGAIQALDKRIKELENNS